jgi:hypothetical protein
MTSVFVRQEAVKVLRINETYWFSRYYQNLRDFNIEVRNFNHSNSKYRVIAGHFPFPNASAVDWQSHRIEYISTSRNCLEMEKSHLFYSLFDNKDAKARIRAGTQTEYLKAQGINNMESCFTSKQCIEKLHVNHIDKFPITDYYCGDCVKRFGYANSTVGSIDRIFNPQPDVGGSGYVSIALTEHFRESFELLKCALPSYFALPIDEMVNISINVGSITNRSYPLLDAAFQQTCTEPDIIYNRLKYRFWKILSYIRRHPQCCRSSNN